MIKLTYETLEDALNHICSVQESPRQEKLTSDINKVCVLLEKVFYEIKHAGLDRTQKQRVQQLIAINNICAFVHQETSNLNKAYMETIYFSMPKGDV